MEGKTKFVNVSEPVMTDYGKIQFSIECAFNELVDRSIKLGLPTTKPMGLMYLPTQELTRNFQVACKDILKSLGVNCEETI